VAHLSRIDSDVPEFRQTLSHQQAETLATTLQRRLLEAPKPLKRRYLRGLVSGIILNREKAVITGPSSAIAASVTSGDFDGPVLTSEVQPRAVNIWELVRGPYTPRGPPRVRQGLIENTVPQPGPPHAPPPPSSVVP